MDPPSECYTILLLELASYGYTVFGLDHPYEIRFLKYPNETGLYCLGSEGDDLDPVLFGALQTIRIR
jgi:hypothetical protein